MLLCYTRLSVTNSNSSGFCRRAFWTLASYQSSNTFEVVITTLYPWRLEKFRFPRQLTSVLVKRILLATRHIHHGSTSKRLPGSCRSIYSCRPAFYQQRRQTLEYPCCHCIGIVERFSFWWFKIWQWRCPNCVDESTSAYGIKVHLPLYRPSSRSRE